jgi:hypothetical protein
MTSSDKGIELDKQIAVEVFESPRDREDVQFTGELVETFTVPQYEQRPNHITLAYLFRTLKGYRLYVAYRNFFKFNVGEYGMLFPFTKSSRTGSRVYSDYSSIEEAAGEHEWLSGAVETSLERDVPGATNIEEPPAPRSTEESRGSWWTRLIRR